MKEVENSWIISTVNPHVTRHYEPNTLMCSRFCLQKVFLMVTDLSKLGLPSLGFPKDKNKVIAALISLSLSLSPAVFFSFSLSYSVCLITVSHSSSQGDGSFHTVRVCWGQNEEKYAQLRLRTHCSFSCFSPMENFIILRPFSQYHQEYRSLSGRKWFWVGGVYI